MRRRSGRFLFLLLALVLACALWDVRSAGAEDGEPTAQDVCIADTQCREDYARARQHFKDKRYADALRFYQQAYARRQAPWLLINIGRAHYRLRQPREALNYYQLYTQTEPSIDTEMQKLIRRYVSEANELLATSAPGPAKGTPPQSEPESSAPPDPPEPPEPPPAPLRIEAPPPAPAPVFSTVNPTSTRTAMPIAANKSRAKPIWRRPLFWALLASGVVLAATATTVAVVVTRQDREAASQPPAPIEIPNDVTRYMPGF